MDWKVLDRTQAVLTSPLPSLAGPTGPRSRGEGAAFRLFACSPWALTEGSVLSQPLLPVLWWNKAGYIPQSFSSRLTLADAASTGWFCQPVPHSQEPPTGQHCQFPSISPVWSLGHTPLFPRPALLRNKGGSDPTKLEPEKKQDWGRLEE